MDSDFDFEDQSGYETDLNDLPDSSLTDKVVSELGDLSNVNDEIESIIEDKPVIKKKVQFSKELDIKETSIDAILVAIIVFIFTNKSIISSIMSVPLLSTYKKSMVFNIILALIISITYFTFKTLYKWFL